MVLDLPSLAVLTLVSDVDEAPAFDPGDQMQPNVNRASGWL